jgi:hypothetical protein
LCQFVSAQPIADTGTFVRAALDGVDQFCRDETWMTLSGVHPVKRIAVGPGDFHALSGADYRAEHGDTAAHAVTTTTFEQWPRTVLKPAFAPSC